MIVLLGAGNKITNLRSI